MKVVISRFFCWERNRLRTFETYINPPHRRCYGNPNLNFMKKFLLCSVALLSAFAVNAQEKVKEVVTADYNRSSLSYVFVSRNHMDSDVRKSYEAQTIGDKFDENIIATEYLEVKTATGVGVSATDVLEAVNNEQVGKEIIMSIFNAQADGSFNDEVVRARGMYNAKDQDIKNLAAAKVKEVAYEWGEPLINSSYILVFDVYKTGRKTSDKGTTYSANAVAHVYKLSGDKAVIDEFYAKAWANPDSSDAEKAAAKAEFAKMRFDMLHVASVSALGSSSDSKYSKGSIYDACNKAFESALFNLEKKISAWQVATAVCAVKPIAAKIGTKEGVKNADRYQAYSYKENKDGELMSVKRGYVRATVISNNSGIATGDTKPSYFYQISGAGNVKEGYTLKEKKDIKLGVSLTGGLAAAGFRLGLDFDYIGHISKRGFITYGMLNAGLNFSGYMLADAAIGAGFGIPASRFFEITPYVMVGGYYDIDSEAIVAYTAEPGVRLMATFHPFAVGVTAGCQAFLGGDYAGAAGVIKLAVKWTF